MHNSPSLIQPGEDDESLVDEFSFDDKDDEGGNSSSICDSLQGSIINNLLKTPSPYPFPAFSSPDKIQFTNVTTMDNSTSPLISKVLPSVVYSSNEGKLNKSFEVKDGSQFLRGIFFKAQVCVHIIILRL